MKTFVNSNGFQIAWLSLIIHLKVWGCCVLKFIFSLNKNSNKLITPDPLLEFTDLNLKF